MKENKKLWFRRKLYGWGWTPVSWQGWLVLFIYVLMMLSFAYINHTEFPDGNLFVGFVFPFVFFSSILIFICYQKGENPKWQWGASIKICDNTSVGIMVWKDGKLLLIERANFPVGFAIPAGHVDKDNTFEIAAKRELKEEVGLETTELVLLLEEKKSNVCRRKGGSWHYWKLYKAEVEGELHRSINETKRAGWYTIEDIKVLANITEKYIAKNITENDWIKNPGLEVVMYEFLKELKII